MRLLNVFLAILYLSVLLSGETRSASQAWVDNTEAQFSHSQSLISQQTSKIADAEIPKDPETKHPVLLQTKTVASALYSDVVAHFAPEQLPHRSVLLTAAPRAPPALA